MSLHPGRFLLTGGTGFIGSHLAQRLIHAGHDVHIITRPGSRLDTLGVAAQQVRAHVYDGTTAGMQAIMDDVKPEIVFHLASYFIAQHQPKDVAPLVESNLLFSTQLVEAMAQTGVPYLINTGTAWQHYDNQDYSPACLYAATKQAFQDIVQFYAEATPLKAITLQIFDTYGPGDPRRKLLAVLKDAALQGTPLNMVPGDQLLDLVYIDDIVEAYVVAAARLRDGAGESHEVFALTSNQPHSIKAIVETVERVTGKTLAINWGARPYRAREVMRPWDRGTRLPGWSAQVDLADGIRRMVGLRGE